MNTKETLERANEHLRNAMADLPDMLSDIYVEIQAAHDYIKEVLDTHTENV